MKLKSEQVNLFRATSDIQEDNKKFERIKEYIHGNIETLREIFDDISISQDEKGMSESTLFHTLVILAVGQVNGS